MFCAEDMDVYITTYLVDKIVLLGNEVRDVYISQRTRNALQYARLGHHPHPQGAVSDCRRHHRPTRPFRFPISFI